MTPRLPVDDRAAADGVTLPAGAPARAPRAPRFHTLRVSAVDRLTDESVAVTFDVPDHLREDFAFQAGQHVAVVSPQVGDATRRNYSICAPAGSGLLRIGVKRLPGGAFSTFALDRLRPGDELEVMTPAGRFHTAFDPARSRHYCMLAAGSGITPILSIMETALSVEPGSRVTLVYGNRATGSIMFLEELQDLKDRHPHRFALVHVLSREPHEVELFHGRLDAPRLTRLLDTLVPPDTVDEWFVCGPFAMVEQARATLRGRGVERSRIHVELFHVDSAPPPAPAANAEVAGRDGGAAGAGSSEVTVVLGGRSTTFPLARDGQRILDAALAVRADAPYACKGGVCGTCRARLVEGEVAMRQNYALEPDEIEAGYVLACQSHPVSDRVTLNFDH